MKKFLSLVLALVLALSLTTVAWGADVAAFNGTNYGTLQAAVDDAEATGGTITLLADCGEDVIVEQKAGVVIVIDGANKTYTGTITVDGKSGTIMTAGITIQNVNFDATSISKDACIRLGDGTNATRYVCNLTVTGCTFTGNYPTTEKVAVKSYTGGDKNVTVTGCTATAMHSLVQLKNATGVTVSDCTITASKNGVSLGASANATIADCEMDLEGYGVRADAIEAGAGVEISDCEIEAFIPVVVRNATQDYNLTFSGTNDMTAENTDGLWCAIGTTEYETNGSLPATSDTVVVTLNDSSLSTSGIHGETMAAAKVGNTAYGTLTEAVATAGSGDTVTMMANAELSAELVIPAGVTLDGAGYTISVAGDTWSTNNEDKHLVELSNNTTVKNVTLDSEGKAYGVQAYCVTGVKLDNVTIKNSKGAGLTVNGSTVEAVDLKASGNAWGSVNVDPGSGVTTESKFAISGADTNLADANAIWGDGDNVTSDANDIEVAISGGTYAGAITVPATAGDVAISGGAFATDVSAYAAPGTSVVPDGFGGYTTAPTANVPTSSSSKPYFTTDFVNFKVSTFCDLTNYKYELRHYYNGADAAKMFDKKVIVAIDEFGGLTYLYECVVATSKDSATMAFVNGTQITYLNTVEKNWVGKATKVPTVDVEDAEKCGDIFVKGDIAVYEDAAGKLYLEDKTGVPYNANGQLVLLKPATVDTTKIVKDLKTLVPADGTVYIVKHTYDYDLKAVNGKQSVTSVFCKDKDCKKTFDFVAGTEAQAIAKFKAGNYVDTGLKINGTTVVWVAKDAAYVGGSVNLPVTLPSTDKVTSADTFDAGIAMYVGMSVLAATGSAVVIGKKKD